MIRLATVIEAFEADFLAQYRDRLSAEHLRALAAIGQCRSQASRRMQVQCPQCEHQRRVPHSCGHRHCPHCQAHESQQWLDRQLQKQVPAQYFLLTFTLPTELRALAWAHQDVLYDLLMRCAWQSVHTFSHNDRQLQGTPGAIAVLHTNTRRLDYHPHVHLVVPAGAIDAEHHRWRTKRAAGSKRPYLFSHKALAKVFRAKMLAAIEATGLALPARHPHAWVVDCKAVGSGEKALVYLALSVPRGDPGAGHRRLRQRPGRLPVSGCEERHAAASHAVRRRFPLAGAAARAAQGLSPGAQLRVSASEQPAPDRTAAGVAEVRTGAGGASATSAAAVRVLRRRHEDRENTAAVVASWRRTCSDCRRGAPLTM